ncbi:hypothetical protein [Clostridium sp. C2-6-12]|uniref:hypothetical protein n=1 Tax=Clostridium sp. C2-6-12 TaxID=2698832 RepID=UPI00136F6765|nr:hypothetical protein [Clostridium sp. C2-6-12]
MKTYAIVNKLDQHTYTLLTKAGIKSKENIYNMSNVRQLLELLELKDKIVVLSVGTFGTCSNLAWILNALIAKQISFISLNERIRFTNTNPIKHVYKQYIMSVLNYEQRLLNDVEQIYKYQERTEINRRINVLCLSLLIETFKNDGILQK